MGNCNQTLARRLKAIEGDSAPLKQTPDHLSTRLPGSFLLAITLCCVNLIVFSQSFAQSRPELIRGVVVDQLRSPVVNAQVSLINGAEAVAMATTDANGAFTLDSRALTTGVVVVRANGFASLRQPWSAQEQSLTLVVVPSPVNEQVTVTATRSTNPLDDTPASVKLVNSRSLQNSAALAVDDALRQVAGFQLFRRSGSRTANPTAQGVSLRGVGASGASRALVLADGVPLNDPFGGWVYWSRVPRAAVDHVEVVRGAASNLYGSTALGGVVQLFRKPTDSEAFEFETSIGNQDTRDGTLFFSEGHRGWHGSLGAELSTTDGYIPVAEAQRGNADWLAGSRHSSFDLRVGKEFSNTANVFARGSLFGESRTNGTRLQTNRTHIRQLVLGGELSRTDIGFFSARVYSGTQLFDQNFTAVSTNRNSETLTRLQRVPVQTTGLGVEWARGLPGNAHNLVAGFDLRAVRGSSDEIAFAQGRPTAFVDAGGRELTTGFFLEDIFRLNSKTTLTASARIDRWKNYRGFNGTRPLAANTTTTITPFAARVQTAFSPNLGIVYRVRESFAITGSMFRAFRQPTLNELYRSFRVGDTLTLANENLRAETLTGGETGFRFSSGRRLNVNSTFFWTEINDPIANATLQVTPTLITRQRQNLGRTRSRGIELESELNINQSLSTSAGYLFAGARVLEFPGNHALEGLIIPQVPRHQFTFQLLYANPNVLSAGLQARAASSQFDDDQNLLRLHRYFTMDARVSKRIASGVELFFAAENLFNSRYEIGRTPVVTVAPPALVRGGLRLSFNK